MLYKRKYFPTQLTLIRLIGSPLIIPALLVYLIPYNNVFINCGLSVLYLLFALTDFFDGLCARQFGHSSTIGAALDPIADKFLLYSTIVGLLVTGKLHFVWALVWLGREFFVMGMRQLSLEYNFSLPVSYRAKMKTCVQSCALAFVICNPYQHLELYAPWWNGVEYSFLFIATLLSITSAKQYCTSFLQQFQDSEWSMM